MTPFARFHDLQIRALRMNHYREVRAMLENFSEDDLADMGIKRYQLGPAARRQALR